MDLGDAKLGAVVGIRLVEEYLRGLQRSGTIPQAFSGESGGIAFTVMLVPLDFEMAKPNGDETYTRLRLLGTVILDETGVALQLDTWVRLAAMIEPAPNQPIAAPVLSFRYGGVDVPPAPPLTEAMIDQLFQSGPVANIFQSLSIPLPAPLISGAGAVLFPDVADPPPAAGLWTVSLALMPADDEDLFADALGIFIDLPGGNAAPTESLSFLPQLTEYGIVYARDFLNVQLAAQSLEGEVIDGAKITDFSLTMGDDTILVRGAATKDIAEILFSGPITIRLLRGSTQFFVDASGVDVDVDLPWWADVFFFLAGPGGFLSLGLVPIFGGMIFDAVKGMSVGDALAEVSAAPGVVRGSISTTFAQGIESLAQALANIGGLGALQPALTPESSTVADGNIAVFAQAFVNPVTEEITGGTFSRRANRLLELQLASGRWLTTSELARIVDLGLITTPGYRAVAPHMRNGTPVRGYMQDEPDLLPEDNLLFRFGAPM